jgi:histidine triad (HIT) family protein
MASIFTRIVRGEIPADKVYEDDDHLAFLDVQPRRPGHTLVIPKREVAYLFDLPPDAYDALWRVVRRVEAGLRAATRCRRVCLAVIGFEVPHVHVHLVPTDEIAHFPLPPAIPHPPDARRELARRIRDAVEAGA